jgi:predicted RND superfamily exporter protein
MFIGIGSLIFAKHPALHSLAEVTIVGMFSVVLMAFVIPPLFLPTGKKNEIKNERKNKRIT